MWWPLDSKDWDVLISIWCDSFVIFIIISRNIMLTHYYIRLIIDIQSIILSREDGTASCSRLFHSIIMCFSKRKIMRTWKTYSHFEIRYNLNYNTSTNSSLIILIPFKFHFHSYRPISIIDTTLLLSCYRATTFILIIIRSIISYEFVLIKHFTAFS